MAQFFFHHPALGQVAGDFGKSDQFALFIVHGVYYDVRPEAAAVLANAPTFLFETALPPSRREYFFRPLGQPVVLGVESREMLTDDLVAGIPFDPFGAEVPVG